MELLLLTGTFDKPGNLSERSLIEADSQWINNETHIHAMSLLCQQVSLEERTHVHYTEDKF